MKSFANGTTQQATLKCKVAHYQLMITLTLEEILAMLDAMERKKEIRRDTNLRIRGGLLALIHNNLAKEKKK